MNSNITLSLHTNAWPWFKILLEDQIQIQDLSWDWWDCKPPKFDWKEILNSHKDHNLVSFMMVPYCLANLCLLELRFITIFIQGLKIDDKGEQSSLIEPFNLFRLPLIENHSNSRNYEVQPSDSHGASRLSLHPLVKASHAKIIFQTFSSTLIWFIFPQLL